METVLVLTQSMLWFRFGLLEMMCGWFTTHVLLGKGICLGEPLSPNALSSCLLLYWSNWFAFMDEFSSCPMPGVFQVGLVDLYQWRGAQWSLTCGLLGFVLLLFGMLELHGSILVCSCPALLVCFGMLACWCSLAYCSLGSSLLQLVNLLLEGPLGLALAVVVSWSRLRVALLPSQFVNEFCWCKVCSLSQLLLLLLESMLLVMYGCSCWSNSLVFLYAGWSLYLQLQSIFSYFHCSQARLLGCKEICFFVTAGFWFSQQMLSLTASLFIYVCLLPFGFDDCSREPVPFDFRLFPRVYSLCFSVQQAYLAYGLFQGVCFLCLGLSVYIYCWSPACFFFFFFFYLYNSYI